MGNHAARTAVIGVRIAMQAFGYPDESPKHIIDLRSKHKGFGPSPSAIQGMFGQRCGLAKRDVSFRLIDLFNRENGRRELPSFNPQERIVVFDSYLDGLGVVINRLEAAASSATNIKEQIGIIAGLSEDVVDQAVKRRLFPRSICEEIQKAVLSLDSGTLRIRTLADADLSSEVPPRDARVIVMEKLNSIMKFN